MTRGFTLIELLIVIAIVAVLAVAVVLVLNPAELIKQGRDSTRISDLGSINSALALYVADGQTTWPTDCVTGGTATLACCQTGTTFPGGIAGSCETNATRNVTGTGWVPVNLGSISSGSPLASLPLDPNNGAACTGAPAFCFYGFKWSSTVGKWVLVANMESSKFAAMESPDGGSRTDWYEMFTDSAL